MSAILTGIFIVALYKTTELVWEKVFDAAWEPVDETLKARSKRWAGRDKASQREVAFAKAAQAARDPDVDALVRSAAYDSLKKLLGVQADRS